jgi:predicted amidohydrolase
MVLLYVLDFDMLTQWGPLFRIRWQDYRMRLPLSLAVAQPRCVPGDTRANGRWHAQAVVDAGARIVVFPELSLTGYEFDAALVEPDDVAVRPDGVAVLYRKQWIGDDAAVRFSPGDEPTVTEVDGWRIGVGICRDTGIGAHVEQMAVLDIDVYVAGLVHRADELSEQERRAVSIAARCRAYVAFASFAGPTGGGYQETAGSSAIWSPARERSRAGRDDARRPGPGHGRVAVQLSELGQLGDSLRDGARRA